MNNNGKWLDLIRTVGAPWTLLAGVIWWMTGTFSEKIDALTAAIQHLTVVVERMAR